MIAFNTIVTLSSSSSRLYHYHHHHHQNYIIIIVIIIIIIIIIRCYYYGFVVIYFYFRLPIFIPVAFSDLNWNSYPHVQLLAASTNFIVHDDITLEVGNLSKCIEQILLSMHSIGLSVDLPESLKHINGDQKNHSSSAASMSSASNSPQDQLLAITESLKAFATSIQALAHQSFVNESILANTIKYPNNNNSTTSMSLNSNGIDDNDDRSRQGLVLSQSYLGVSNGSMILTDKKHPASVGYQMKWWNSLQLEILHPQKQQQQKQQHHIDNEGIEIKDNADDKDNNDDNNGDDDKNQHIIAVVTETNLRKVGISPSGNVIDGRDMTVDHPLYNWGHNLFVRISNFKGEFIKEQLLLTGMVMITITFCCFT
jgi:hypothetical protein